MFELFSEQFSRLEEYREEYCKFLMTINRISILFKCQRGKLFKSLKMYSLKYYFIKKYDIERTELNSIELIIHRQFNNCNIQEYATHAFVASIYKGKNHNFGITLYDIATTLTV